MTIDLSRPKNDRITELKVNTGDVYEDLVDAKVYKIVTTNYVANKGGDGYKVPQYKLSQIDGKFNFFLLKNFNYIIDL